MVFLFIPNLQLHPAASNEVQDPASWCAHCVENRKGGGCRLKYFSCTGSPPLGGGYVLVKELGQKDLKENFSHKDLDEKTLVQKTLKNLLRRPSERTRPTRPSRARPANPRRSRPCRPWRKQTWAAGSNEKSAPRRCRSKTCRRSQQQCPWSGAFPGAQRPNVAEPQSSPRLPLPLMNMQRKQQNVLNGGSRALCNWAGMAPDVMESTCENQMLQTVSQSYSSSKTDV